jgi:mono/diheme cytochrome c family protein
MIRILSLLGIVGIVALIAVGGITLYDETLQVGRMWETPAIKPHEQPMPVSAGLSIPTAHGEVMYRTADPDKLAAPFDLSDPHHIASGETAYRYYCVHCHGTHYDGYGTVGQSFFPAPGDLRSARIQNMADGRIFHEISYGIAGGRQPALATTIAIEERWQIVGFIKSLGVSQQNKKKDES